MISSWEKYKIAAEKAAAEGNWDESAAMWVAALDEAETFPPKDPRIAYTIEHLADVSEKRGRHDLAEQLYEKVVILKSNIQGPFHLEVGATANKLAELYYAHEKFDLAEPMFKRVLKVYETAFGACHVGVAIIALNLATMYDKRGDFVEAETLFKRAIDIYTKLNGYNHPETLKALDAYADMLIKMGRSDEAHYLKQATQGSVANVWHDAVNNKTAPPQSANSNFIPKKKP